MLSVNTSSAGGVAPDSAPHLESGAVAPALERTPPKSTGASTTVNLLFGLPLRPIDTIALLLCVAIADFFLYWDLGGAGYGLATFAWTGVLWATAQDRRGETPVLLAATAIVLLAVRNLWLSGPLSAFMPVPLIVALAVIQRTPQRHLVDAWVAGAFSLMVSPLRACGHLISVGSLFRRRGASIAAAASGYAIPVAAALVTIIIFGWVFSQANPVIDEWIGWFFRWVGEIIEKLFPYLDRCLLWIFIACIAAALIRPVLNRSALLPEEHQNAGSAPSPLQETLGLTSLFVLGTSCALFLLFNAVDFVYLWLKGALPAGITYSSYARQGAGWLTFALFLSSLLIGAASSEHLLGWRRYRWIRELSYAWAVIDFIMAIGVLRRVDLYVQYNGLTPLRITAIFGISIVAAGVVIMCIKIHRQRNFAWLVRRYIAAFTCGVILYTLSPDGYLSSLYNVSAASRGNIRPLVWLFEGNYRSEVNAEALPPLLALLDHPDPLIARGIAAYLGERLTTVDGEHETWRSAQLAELRAQNLLRKNAHRLSDDAAALSALREAVGTYR